MSHGLRRRNDESWFREALPSVIPAGWTLLGRREDGAAYRNDLVGLQVIISAESHDDGRRWLHLSVSNPTRLPKWRELVEVKELFLGLERYAYQVVPPRSRYVNIHPFVLHLFSCLDGEPLPDFTQGSGSL